MTTNYRELFEESCKVYAQNSRLDAMAGRIDKTIRAVANNYLPAIFCNTICVGIYDSLTGILDSDDGHYDRCCEALDDELFPSDSLYDTWKNTGKTPALISEGFSDTQRIFCGENYDLDNGDVALVMMHPFAMLQICVEHSTSPNNGNDIATEVQLFWQNDGENRFFQLCDLCDALQHT